MNTLRQAISVILIALLTLGYLGSQYARVYGDPQDWARKMDQPAIVGLSLVLFLSAVALFIIPEPERDETTP